MEVNLDEELLARINEHIKGESFDSVDDFIHQAITLLLYAEDNKDLFSKSLGN